MCCLAIHIHEVGLGRFFFFHPPHPSIQINANFTRYCFICIFQSEKNKLIHNFGKFRFYNSTKEGKPTCGAFFSRIMDCQTT